MLHNTLVLKELHFLQKQYREQVSLDMLDSANSDPTFMERITAGDETSELRTKDGAKTEKITLKLLKSQGDAHCFL